MNVKFFVKSALASALALLSVNAFANDGQNVTANASISQPAGEALFFQCAAIIGNNERLACFDSLAQGEVPTTSEKQPLDLSATVGSTLRGKPRAVMADSLSNKNHLVRFLGGLACSAHVVVPHYHVFLCLAIRGFAKALISTLLKLRQD